MSTNNPNATAGDTLVGLPRSVRWRIQLGLLVDPSQMDPTVTTFSSETDTAYLESVFQWNQDTISQQTTRFHQLMEQYVEEEMTPEEEEAAAAAADMDKQPAEVEVLDPLTAMVMEQEARETRKAELLLKYRKERARRKRGLTAEAGYVGEDSDGIDRASLAIIEKDLKRLPHPSVNGESTSPNDLTPALEERVTTLREILYIYAQEHPNMGYRQGMHEIASYLLFCLEQEHPKYPDNPLFTPIMPICFVLLETLLGQLHTAYDASGSTQSLQTMSHSILGKIHQNDPSLYQHLTSSPNIPPPPIYCTRWVRLLFSREVVGYENVFQLWDVFFEYKNVMRVLEVTSACRILLLRNELLNPEKNPLDLLMNVPQLSDISQLANVLRRLMQQKDADHPIQLPPSQILPTGSPVMSSQESPPHPPTGYPLMPAAHPLAGPRGGESPTNKFNLSKMRQTLGQKGESLRQKIITTTNEWKEAASRETSASGNSFTGFATNSDMIATATQAIRNNTGSTRPTETVLFSDPLMHPPPAQSPAPVRGNPPSPRQHLHEMWSQLLKQKIWTVQHFCMSIESNENGRTVPREVWEALADMDQMRHELHNYSLNMPG